MTPQDLVGQRWVVGAGTEGSPEFGTWPDLPAPEVAFPVRSWPARLGLVAAALGIAMVPGQAADVVPRGARWVPVDTGGVGLGRTTWAVTATSPGSGAAAAVRALVEQARS